MKIKVKGRGKNFEDLAIGERLKTFRKFKKLSRKELGSSIDRSEGSIQSYELGRVRIPNGVIELLVNHFKVNKNWLILGIGEMLQQPKLELEEYRLKPGSIVLPTVNALAEISNDDFDGLLKGDYVCTAEADGPVNAKDINKDKLYIVKKIIKGSQKHYPAFLELQDNILIASSSKEVLHEITLTSDVEIYEVKFKISKYGQV